MIRKKATLALVHSAEDVRSFTSRKLDLLKCCAFDPRVSACEFRVLYVIVQHLNQRTGLARLSDETIADEAGRCSTRQVRRARAKLRKLDWLTWTRTNTANSYKVEYAQVERFLDLIAIFRDERAERRARRGVGVRGPLR